MTTLNDVAKRAGVSPMTVSRVINNSGYIHKKTRERVEQAIAELGYVPNALARSLRFKQTKTLALLISDITNPFFTTLARGVEDAASEQGFSVILCNTDESRDKEAQYLNVVIQKQVDGVLLVPAVSSVESGKFLQDCGVPFVVLDRRAPGLEVDIVRCDTEIGAYQLTNHLIELGHRRIVALSGPMQVTTAADRIAGYHRALAEAGLEDFAREYYGGFTVKSGYDLTKRVLASEEATALLAANNFIVFGALRALKEANLRVPDDISVVTFDDLLEVMGVEPFLTVVRQPAYDLGRRATQLMLDRLSGAATGAPQEILLPTQLIVRQSSAAPRAQPS
ncbi:MAG: LacI family DNA-binding transcriptional regulator [Anaerolineae bacterium]